MSKNLQIILNKTNKNKVKLVTNVNQNELALIIGLTSYKDDSKEGWMTKKEILAEKGTDGLILFKSNRDAFSNYIKPLIDKQLIQEQKKAPFTDAKRRKVFKNIYRLKRDEKTRYNVHSLILKSVSFDERYIDKEHNKNGFFCKLNIDLTNILSRGYFKQINLGYNQVIDDSIKSLELKIRLLKQIKQTRTLNKTEVSNKK